MKVATILAVFAISADVAYCHCPKAIQWMNKYNCWEKPGARIATVTRIQTQIVNRPGPTVFVTRGGDAATVTVTTTCKETVSVCPDNAYKM
ncbi:hypothetical protein H072_6623 [Dactylellina haptotyla CBS 200.50]|uniref:Uncharacterized protein n=1 Tax=Dactylellina haptotyla (strain CBS 200.50) TaxID=1284197 RepID=S8BJL4_DACHA|nr:hypothetical protein H072_6623 [Dactylellina haptotyla CBS 200.50]